MAVVGNNTVHVYNRKRSNFKTSDEEMDGKTDLRIKIRCIQVNMVKLLTTNSRVQHMLRTRAEVATMQISENSRRTDK